ncbi:hypothetical protein BVRB_3g052050 isoform B [Beta vulgaris subsp. vulgaris]|nr:hypothetical protein BVRB_3g052050 isoform B [Beta vulgaris subsp. vulgaris]
MACGQWLKPINTRSRTKDEVVEPLSPASRLFHAPQLNCCIIAMVGCKTMINVEVIKDGINQTMVKHPRISSKLDTNTPVKASRGTEKGPKKFVYRILSLDDIKLVKNVMNVTINDVIVGITQAGLSRYLNRKYGESKGDQNVQQNHLPQHIRLRSTLLVNIRPTSKIQDLAEQMESNDPKRKWEWGNSIGYILLPFDIALRDNPLDYIRKAKTTIDKKKQSLEAVFTFICAEFILKALGLGVTATITHRALSNATLSFSNVVGPKEEISFYGHPMTFLAPSVYGHPHALTVHFQSYMDQMTLVLAVDQNVIPEPHRLCDDIEEFLAFAKEAAQKKKIFHI